MILQAFYGPWVDGPHPALGRGAGPLLSAETYPQAEDRHFRKLNAWDALKDHRLRKPRSEVITRNTIAFLEITVSVDAFKAPESLRLLGSLCFSCCTLPGPHWSTPLELLPLTLSSTHLRNLPVVVMEMQHLQPCRPEHSLP